MNPPNTPPNVPGPSSNMPPSGMPSGASGGAQNIPPMGGPPPMSTPPRAGGGGLFTPRNIIIGLVALLLLCACACGATLFALGGLGNLVGSQIQTQVPGGFETVQVVATGTDFMNKLKGGDWSGAYALCTPDLQKELGSAQALGKRITDGKAQPVSWNFQDFSTIKPDSQDAQIDGTATFSGNRSGTLRLVLDRVGTGNSWQISGFNLKPN